VSGPRSTGDDSGAYPTRDVYEGPFFFLSYKHPWADDRGAQVPDVWIGKLYRDLCVHVREIAGLPPVVRPGFMDQELRPGNEWPDRLARALATCRVFVPLYSKHYFRSVHCGKEWFAFNRRRLNTRARNGYPIETIVPALWVPVPAEMLPEAATSVQFSSAHFSDLYAEHGFYGIMKVSRWRAEYEEAVYLLAREIVKAAEAVAAADPVPEPVETVPYEMLPAAFGGDGKAGPGDKPLRVTVVAPSRDNLPAGRDGSYYGKDIRAWNPYGQTSVRPLAEHAADLARSLSYTPDVGDLYRHEAGLDGREPWAGPQVLLIDPWATLLTEIRDILRRVDELDNPWVQVIVVWSQDDAQMAMEAERVTAGLNAALPRKLREGRAISVLAVRGVPSLREFGMVLPPVITEAGRHYLRRASSPSPRPGQPSPDQNPNGRGGQ
jgi:FxsC-like protein